MIAVSESIVRTVGGLVDRLDESVLWDRLWLDESVLLQIFLLRHGFGSHVSSFSRSDPPTNIELAKKSRHTKGLMMLAFS